jgi:hypothetical protein
MRFHTTHTRDAALNRLSRINRWLIAGSVVLTGALSEVAANAFPGKTIKAGAARKPKGSTAHPSTSTSTTTAPLRPPAQAPESAPTQESAPAQESAPSQEPAPSQESSQSAPAQESPPAQESAPAQEPSAPVVSGGS